jgi:hypothetical protein
MIGSEGCARCTARVTASASRIGAPVSTVMPTATVELSIAASTAADGSATSRPSTIRTS